MDAGWTESRLLPAAFSASFNGLQGLPRPLQAGFRYHREDERGRPPGAGAERFRKLRSKAIFE